MFNVRIDINIKNEAKAIAAMNGQSLQDFVKEALLEKISKSKNKKG